MCIRDREKVVELWREQIEAKAGGDLDRLTKTIEDQRGFARTVRDMLAALDMAEQTAQGDEQDEDEDNQDQSSEDQQQQDGESEQESGADRSEVEVSEDATEELQEGASEATDAPAGDWEEEDENSESEEAGEAPRPRESRGNERPQTDYKAYTQKFDEVVTAEELCDAEELTRLRAYLDKQLAHLPVSYTHLDVYKRQELAPHPYRRRREAEGSAGCLLYTSRCV